MVARPNIHKGIRHPVDAIRVQYWCQGLKEKTGSKNAYQLEKLLEPLSPANVDIRTHFRCKWIRYEYGKHIPRIRLLYKIEAKCPGSLKEFQHPVWEILKTPEKCLNQLDDWFLKLSPKVQSCVFKPPSTEISETKQRRELAYWLPRQLMEFADLDVLAAFLLYWLEAQHTGQVKQIRTHAFSLYQLLLILGVKLNKRGIAEAMFDVVCHVVFKPTQWGNEFFATDSDHYMDSVYLLNINLYKVEDFSYKASWPKRCQLMYKLLDGKYGFDALLGLNPLFLPSKHEKQQNVNSFEIWQQSFMLKLWGWIHLNHQSIGNFDDEVYRLLDIAFGFTKANKGDLISARQTVLELLPVTGKVMTFVTLRKRTGIDYRARSDVLTKAFCDLIKV